VKGRNSNCIAKSRPEDPSRKNYVMLLIAQENKDLWLSYTVMPRPVKATISARTSTLYPMNCSRPLAPN
jgi:hypothetical protein